MVKFKCAFSKSIELCMDIVFGFLNLPCISDVDRSVVKIKVLMQHGSNILMACGVGGGGGGTGEGHCGR